MDYYLHFAKQGGGVVNRVGQGVKPLPFALCISAQNNRINAMSDILFYVIKLSEPLRLPNQMI